MGVPQVRPKALYMIDVKVDAPGVRPCVLRHDNGLLRIFFVSINL